MPTYLLGVHQGGRFDVVGNRGGTTNAITHVGLLATPSALTLGLKVAVLDMAPPLRIDPPGQFEAHVSATLPLTRDEVAAIEEWIAEIRTLISQCKYLAHPAAQEDRDPLSRRLRGWKFSCAGFVVTAYEQAGIRLIDAAQLPPLHRDTVIEVWRHIAGDTTQDRQRIYLRMLGLKGDGPWSVLVPGYILHALNQSRAGLPYSPTPADIDFPQAPTTARASH